ncbi:uncharacterized protein I303_102963 [Kwoniella dejecticola CBS 10117]|uniref:Uncharacterized protein n=1 Tax=Kwoniella dejecticola CBS 10117 TaxID=1296121 RepID=A0A1A6AA78_9TREE|nr:uncharacterized protein I303_02982 [Kwoniella dejecticola CBS 10117]OBR86960.1 hypothetical protein I303_02982 [Kwoniella dejecticola CBS 10117]
MAIVEDITAETEAESSTQASKQDLISDVERLTAQLQVPAGLVPGFMAAQDESGLSLCRLKASRILRDVAKSIDNTTWQELEAEDQFRLMENVIRLNGNDPWSSLEMRSIVNDILPRLSPAIPLLILSKLKPYFASHPSLSSASRALSRPIGGQDSTIDLHDVQPFKDPSAWGIPNLLSFAVCRITPAEVEKNIGLILPPTLILMDDWEPLYRLRGAQILEQWMDKIDSEMMKRMGIDKLLINSLIHTISLQSNPPLKGVLDITVKLIDKCTVEYSKERTEWYCGIVEKGIIQGWLYAPSGLEGRAVLIHVNEMLGLFCELMGTGIIRWLKNIIPNLLQPLQYPPTRVVLPHYHSNLSTLLLVMQTMKKTGRLGRWRGQILNILCRLWVQLKDRRGIVSFPDDDDAEEGDDAARGHDPETDIQSLIKRIFAELADQIPSVKEEEYPRLLKLDPVLFGDLVSTSTP